MKSLARKGFTVLIVALACSAHPAAADCKQWDVSGTFLATQASKRKVEMRLIQEGNKITGEVFQYTLGVGTGKVEGSLVGNKFEIVVRYEGTDSQNDSHHEVYEGTINPQGVIEGTAIVFGDRSGNMKWSGDIAMTCTSKPVTSQRPNGSKPGITRGMADWSHGGHGDAKTSSTTTNTRPATTDPMKAATDAASKVGANYSSARPTKTGPVSAQASGAPAISASATSVKIPHGKKHGGVTITWDGGKDHPYAEVWVKTESEDEKFVVERGKGSEEMKVKPGRNVFILTDSGQRLATVVVEGH